jgi:hypothetical protein
VGLFDRVERRLERAVNGAFARAFKAEVQPVEIAAAMRRAMDDRAAVLGHGRTIVPNLFTVELAPSDYERLDAYSDVLSDELVASAQEHAESQRYQPGGPIAVHFTPHDDLETGVFRVRTATARRAEAQAATPAPAPAPAPVREHRPAPPAAVPAQPAPAAAPRAVPAAPDPDATRAHTPAPAPARAFGDPTKRPWLDIDGEHYPLLSAITVLGRDDTADVILDDPGISRRHTEIRVTSDGPHLVTSIRDLGSTNGTFVNSERITSQRLEDGDRLTVGRTTLTFRAERR